MNGRTFFTKWLQTKQGSVKYLLIKEAFSWIAQLNHRFSEHFDYHWQLQF